MTHHVRTSYRKHPRAMLATAIVVFAAAALAISLPALAIDNSPCNPNTTTCVKPASAEGIFPSMLSVGGSNFSCATHAGGSPANMRQFQISKPTPGTYTDPATGVRFVVTAPSSGKDTKAYFSFSTGGAAVVYHVGVNGGTDTAWYDYYNNEPAHPAIAGTGVFSDQDLHSTPDSKYQANPESKNTFFVASITTFCYVPLPTVPLSCTTPFSGGPSFGGTAATVEYSAQLVAGAGGACKNGDAVMYSYTSGATGFYAALYPLTPGGQQYGVVERIRWIGVNSGDDQNPITLRYDDTAPYDGVDYPTIANVNGNSWDGWREMKLCASDPRPDPVDEPFVLGSSGAPTMPAATDGYGTHTSCMLVNAFSAGTAANSRTYEAWVFSNIDGSRGFS